MEDGDPSTAGLWGLAQWWDAFNMQRTDEQVKPPTEMSVDDLIKKRDPYGANYIITLDEWGEDGAIRKIRTARRANKTAHPLIVQLAEHIWGVRLEEKMVTFADARQAVAYWISFVGDKLEGGHPVPRLF